MIPSVENLRKDYLRFKSAGESIAAEAIEAAEEVTEPARRIRDCLFGVFTSHPTSWYWNRQEKLAGFSGLHRLPSREAAYVLSAVGEENDICPEPVRGPDQNWIKVAYSPTIRRVGEYLNFFEGKYPFGLPNLPGPYTSMLTTGLLGGGLGYGAGWLGEKVLPASWEKGKLRRTLRNLGIAAGVAPGLIWGLTNLSTGRRFGDPSLLSGPPPENYQIPKEGSDWSAYSAPWRDAERKFFDFLFCKEAAAGGGGEGDYDALAVNINSMGQTLWEAGASPGAAAVTIGSLQAAEQLPGGKGQGFVTPQQMGRLAMGLGGGYLTGAVVGATLGALAGMPESQQRKLRRTGALLGIVNAVVPAIFGQ